jgi:hypothetical protein
VGFLCRAGLLEVRPVQTQRTLALERSCTWFNALGSRLEVISNFFLNKRLYILVLYWTQQIVLLALGWRDKESSHPEVPDT